MPFERHAVMLFENPQERPRERMMLFGPQQVADVELLALVLGGGTALDRAMTLLHGSGGLQVLARSSPNELRRAPGVGLAGATAICAAFELGRRAAQVQLPHASAITGPDDVADYLRASLGNSSQETFAILGLDARRRLQMVRTIAVGSIASVEVHPREVFRPLVQGGLGAVILVHNHPSGDAQPSTSDLVLTQRMKAVGDLLGIPVLDHFVVSHVGIVSLAEQGLFEELV